MNEHQIRSESDLRAALTVESIMAEARRQAAAQRMRGRAKTTFMRACRKVAEAQNKSKGCN